MKSRVKVLLSVLAVGVLASCNEQQSPTQFSVEEPASINPTHSNSPRTDLAPQLTLDADQETLARIERQVADYKASLVSGAKRSPRRTTGTIVVPDPGAGILTIQDGVDAATPGDIVQVNFGPFTEDVIIATPNIKVSADGPVTLFGSFTVAADNVTITGFEVIYSGFAAIIGQEVTGVEFTNNTVSGGATAGIVLSSATNCKMTGNSVSGTFFGIALVQLGGVLPRPTGNSIRDNTTTGNLSAGIQVQDAEFTKVQGNICTSNGRPDGGNGGIALVRSNDNEIKHNESSFNIGFGRGVFLFANSTNNAIQDNICRNNSWVGIQFFDSSHNTIKNNALTGNLDGIVLEFADSHDNEITNNICNNLFAGVGIFRSAHHNVIKDNTLAGNTTGVDIFLDSHSNVITDNVCTNNSFSGMDIRSGSTNNEASNNVCNNNTSFGISIFAADGNTIGPSNEANDNGFWGIRVFGDNNVIDRNKAFNNAFCDIVLQGGTGNTFNKNEADCTIF